MNATEQTTTTTETITHPGWCQNYPDVFGNHKGDCDAPMGTHLGQDYRLDAGDTAAFVVEVRPQQYFEVIGDHVDDCCPPFIRMEVRNREVEGYGESVSLSVEEAERLRELLAIAIRDIKMYAPSVQFGQS